jgi:hypothetical protein
VFRLQLTVYENDGSRLPAKPTPVGPPVIQSVPIGITSFGAFGTQDSHQKLRAKSTGSNLVVNNLNIPTELKVAS